MRVGLLGGGSDCLVHVLVVPAAHRDDRRGDPGADRAPREDRSQAEDYDGQVVSVSVFGPDFGVTCAGLPRVIRANVARPARPGNTSPRSCLRRLHALSTTTGVAVWRTLMRMSRPAAEQGLELSKIGTGAALTGVQARRAAGRARASRGRGPRGGTPPGRTCHPGPGVRSRGPPARSAHPPCTTAPGRAGRGSA